MTRDLDALFGTFEVELSMLIKASPDAVWDLITDITRIKDFSPEVIHAEWLDDGPQGPVAGARFAGTNRLGEFEWTRTCTVVEARRPVVFAYVVGDRFDGAPSGRWSFQLSAHEEGTVLLQRFSHAPEGRSGTRLLAEQDPDKAEELIDTRRQILERGMAATLGGIRKAIEGR